MAVVLAHTAEELTSIQALISTRTAQGAIAWAVGLNTCPYVALPAYWVSDRSKFEGYVIKRREGQVKSSPFAPGRGEPGNRVLACLLRQRRLVGFLPTLP